MEVADADEEAEEEEEEDADEEEEEDENAVVGGCFGRCSSLTVVE